MSISRHSNFRLPGFLRSLRGGSAPSLHQRFSISEAISVKKEFDTLVESSLGIPAVVGTGFGFRGHSGVGVPALVLMLSEESAWNLNAVSDIPDAVGGLPVWVETVAEPTPCWGWFPPKAQGGCGFGMYSLDGRLGTLGALIRKNGDTLALTCEHGLTQPDLTIPWDVDVYWRHPHRRHEWTPCGKIAEVGGIDYEHLNADRDFAIVRVDVPSSKKVIGLGRCETETLDGFLAVATRARVAKSGASTGVTIGRVQGSFKIRVKHPMPNDKFLLLRYTDVLEIVHEKGDVLCDQGDSGSVFFEYDRVSARRRAVGLLFSTSPRYKGYAIPIGRALTHFKAEMA